MRESKPTRPRRGRPSARDRILDAALALIGDIGVPAVTLDGVAARAGVSKGGLLYHFRFKEQLLTAANERLVRRRAKAREAEARHLPKGKGRRLKAYVLASVNNSEGDDEISAKLLVAGSMTAEAAEPIRRYFRERFPPFADDVGFDRAALVHAATEGLWFMDVLRLSPFSAKQRARLVKTILAVADGAPLAIADPE
jgi:AcrR family transcriptional regulator